MLFLHVLDLVSTGVVGFESLGVSLGVSLEVSGSFSFSIATGSSTLTSSLSGVGASTLASSIFALESRPTGCCCSLEGVDEGVYSLGVKVCWLEVSEIVVRV